MMRYMPHPYWTILEIVVSPISLVSLLFIEWGRNNKTSLIPPSVIEVLVTSQESERSCICVLGFRFCLCFYDSFSAGRWHTNGYELCPSSSRFIFILI